MISQQKKFLQILVIQKKKNQGYQVWSETE